MIIFFPCIYNEWLYYNFDIPTILQFKNTKYVVEEIILLSYKFIQISESPWRLSVSFKFSKAYLLLRWNCKIFNAWNRGQSLQQKVERRAKIRANFFVSLSTELAGNQWRCYTRTLYTEKTVWLEQQNVWLLSIQQKFFVVLTKQFSQCSQRNI